MKRIIFSLFLLGLTSSLFAQSESYKTAMLGLLEKVKTAKTVEALTTTKNGFERIAVAEKKEWLPWYYAAFCQVLMCYLPDQKDNADSYLDLADRYLKLADDINANDEILCLKSWALSARIMVNPMTRGQKYGLDASNILNRAESLNLNNPRIAYLKAQNTYYTPVQFGGGEKAAKILFEKAMVLYEKFKPLNEMMPTWGKEETKEMLDKYKGK